MQPRIIYIAGTGHSGSTLLDLLISSHHSVVSVGEAKMLKPGTGMSRRCSCGAATTVWACEFWREVDEVLGRLHSLDLQDLDLGHRNPAAFVHHNRAFFEAVAQVSSKSVIVDSSKQPRRLARLMRSGRFDVTPIHLVRAPQGVAHSEQQRRGRHWLITSAAYVLGHRRIRRLLGDTDTSVRYETLADDPVESMRRLMPAIGLDFEPSQLDWAGRTRHNVGGNRMRFSGTSTIALDTAWESEMPRWRQRAIQLLTTNATTVRRPAAS